MRLQTWSAICACWLLLPLGLTTPTPSGEGNYWHSNLDSHDHSWLYPQSEAAGQSADGAPRYVSNNNAHLGNYAPPNSGFYGYAASDIPSSHNNPVFQAGLPLAGNPSSNPGYQSGLTSAQNIYHPSQAASSALPQQLSDWQKQFLSAGSSQGENLLLNNEDIFDSDSMNHFPHDQHESSSSYSRIYQELQNLIAGGQAGEASFQHPEIPPQIDQHQHQQVEHDPWQHLEGAHENWMMDDPDHHPVNKPFLHEVSSEGAQTYPDVASVEDFEPNQQHVISGGVPYLRTPFPRSLAQYMPKYFISQEKFKSGPILNKDSTVLDKINRIFFAGRLKWIPFDGESEPDVMKALHRPSGSYAVQTPPEVGLYPLRIVSHSTSNPILKSLEEGGRLDPNGKDFFSLWSVPVRLQKTKRPRFIFYGLAYIEEQDDAVVLERLKHLYDTNGKVPAAIFRAEGKPEGNQVDPLAIYRYNRVLDVAPPKELSQSALNVYNEEVGRSYKPEPLPPQDKGERPFLESVKDLVRIHLHFDGPRNHVRRIKTDADLRNQINHDFFGGHLKWHPLPPDWEMDRTISILWRAANNFVFPSPPGGFGTLRVHTHYSTSEVTEALTKRNGFSMEPHQLFSLWTTPQPLRPRGPVYTSNFLGLAHVDPEYRDQVKARLEQLLQHSPDFRGKFS